MATYNSPHKLYSEENLKNAVENQAETLATGVKRYIQCQIQFQKIENMSLVRKELICGLENLLICWQKK